MICSSKQVKLGLLMSTYSWDEAVEIEDDP
jgi:hypothetical protein